MARRGRRAIRRANWGDTRTVRHTPPSTIHGMDRAPNRQRLANFIDLALTPWKLYGRPVAAVPIPRSVLATCGEEMHILADALRDERREGERGALGELR